MSLWADAGGRLQGAWLLSHVPLAIGCYGLGGASLGAGKPLGEPGAWQLPAQPMPMLLILRMRDGTRIPYLLAPGSLSPRSP